MKNKIVKIVKILKIVKKVKIIKITKNLLNQLQWDKLLHQKKLIYKILIICYQKFNH